MPAPRDVRGRPPGLDLGVLAAAALLLAGGLGYARAGTTSERAATALGGAIRLTVPAGWASGERAGRFDARPPALGGGVASLTIDELKVPAEPAAAALFLDLATARIERETAELGAAYRVLRTEEGPAFGHPRASVTRFALVREPPGARPGAAVLPEVVEGINAVLLTRGGRAFRISAMAPVADFEDEQGPLAAALASIEVRP